MNLPYPLERGETSLEKYLLHMVTALVKKAGGEARLDACDILEASTCSLSKSVTAEKDGIILRTSPEGAELYFSAEAPPPSKTRVISTSTEDPLPAEIPKARSRQLTELDQYLIEQDRAAKTAMREQVVEPGVYPWHSTPIPRQ